MPKRNRVVQRAARQLRDRGSGTYTEARATARTGQRLHPMLPCPAMVDTVVWSRYGRWAFGTDDWQNWTFRTGCGHIQSPRDVARNLPGARPEAALTQCLRHDSDTDPSTCPPAGAPGTKYYRVFWWHACTPVFPFAYDRPHVVRGPLTEADDLDVIVPGITRPVDNAAVATVA